MADKIFHTGFVEKVAPVGADKIMLSDSEATNQTKFTDIANLPVSTPTSTAIGVVQSDINAHEARTDNPHSVTKAQVGLSDVDNTSDANKPISTATQTALNAKQDTLTGLTASVAELNYTDGVTSPIQTQLNGKQPSMGSNDNYVTDAEKIVIGNTSGANTGDNATNTTSNSYADGKVEDSIVNGHTTVAPSGNAVFDALAGKAALAGNISQDFSASQIEVGHASDTTITRVSVGRIAVEGAIVAHQADITQNTKQDLALALTPNYDAINGAIVLDSSKNHYHGTVSGAIYIPNGGLNGGGVYDFDGVDDYIELNDGGSVGSVYTNGFTIIGWIKPDSDGEAALGTIIGKNAGTLAQSGYYYSVNANTLRMRIADGAGTGTNRASGASSITYGNWHHVTVTVDNTGFVTHYINAVQSGTPGISSAPSNITTTNATRIGNRSTATDRTFDGYIGPVRIISRVLTATEIANDYLQRTEIDNPPEVPRLTTAMRDVMTPSLGQQIYNTTTNKSQVYNGAWNDLY